MNFFKVLIQLVNKAIASDTTSIQSEKAYLLSEQALASSSHIVSISSCSLVLSITLYSQLAYSSLNKLILLVKVSILLVNYSMVAFTQSNLFYKAFLVLLYSVIQISKSLLSNSLDQEIVSKMCSKISKTFATPYQSA